MNQAGRRGIQVDRMVAMELNWSEILANISVYALLIGAASWVAKALGEQFLKMRFRAYEKELEGKSIEFKAQLDRSLEQFRAELQLANTKDSRLHEKRMLVLESLYQKIVSLNAALKEMTATLKFIHTDADQEEDERIKTASQAYDAFLKYYTENKIFFSLESCVQLDALRNSYFDSMQQYNSSGFILGNNGFRPDFGKAQMASEIVRKAIPVVMQNIENDFRQLLGVK
ncbi:hypothetical protein [Hymenobacter qilianensis]|nr:hypothetical protein [Hymenobacter qilianensis]